VRTVIHLERWRTGERLRRRVDPGHLLITTGLKRRWIVVTVRLHPMAQLTQHLHQDRALFLAFGDGFLTAIGRSRDQAGVCFNLSLQILRLDRRIHQLWVVRHSVHYGDSLCSNIFVREGAVAELYMYLFSLLP